MVPAQTSVAPGQLEGQQNKAHFPQTMYTVETMMSGQTLMLGWRTMIYVDTEPRLRQATVAKLTHAEFQQNKIITSQPRT